MSNGWEQWEGRTIDGFTLGKYLGGSEQSAVFRARKDGGGAEDAAIRFVAVDWADAEKQLERWKRASELTHPNLIRISGMGQCAVAGREFVYVVEEFAEENLAQIVPERALTEAEARGMVGPVLSALEFVHNRGFVHGRVRPSNILAAGDQVKLSSDSLREAGVVPRAASAYDAPEVSTHGISAASDVWSLGMTLAQVMTRHTPVWDAARMSAAEVGGEIPEPFRGIVARCVEIDPGKRCGLQEIRERLEPSAAHAQRETAGAVRRTVTAAEVPPQVVVAPIVMPEAIPSEKRTARWVCGVLLAAAAVVGGFLMVRSHSSGAGSSVENAKEQPGAIQSTPVTTAPAQPGASAAETEPKSAEAPTESTTAKEAGTSTKDDVVERVMPEVAPSARRTIQGKIRVKVRVDVDSGGRVTEARLKDAGPSKYFARISVEAARRWKFAPATDASREWTLMFAFTRARTEAVATRVRGTR